MKTYQQNREQVNGRHDDAAINPTGMVGRVELITKERADTLLSRSGGNRTLRRGRVDRYKKEREEGNWALHHQGIGVDEEGVLIDGHHRLTMVSETGLATAFFVVYNVPRQGVVHVDEQLPRTVVDALKMAGRGDFSTSIAATAAVFEQLPGAIRLHSTLSRDELCAVLTRHAEALAFSERYRHQRICPRAIRALLARAWLARPADRDRVQLFGDTLADRDIGGDHSAASHARRLRAYITDTVSQKSAAVETDRYRKGQTALAAYLDGGPAPVKLYATDKDLFFLPAAEGD
jgi:hypothetical protein